MESRKMFHEIFESHMSKYSRKEVMELFEKSLESGMVGHTKKILDAAKSNEGCNIYGLLDLDMAKLRDDITSEDIERLALNSKIWVQFQADMKQTEYSAELVAIGGDLCIRLYKTSCADKACPMMDLTRIFEEHEGEDIAIIIGFEGEDGTDGQH